MGDEYEDSTLIEILTEDVDFGLHLDAYAQGVSLNPLKVKVKDHVADRRHIKLKVQAFCNNDPETVWEWPVTLVVNNVVKISGLIDKDSTLTADHIYYVNEDLGIMEGATLTIEPGTRLEFGDAKGISLFDNSRLKARGKPEKPIVFTTRNGSQGGRISSYKDTQYHDCGACLYTNADSTLFTLLPTEKTNQRINLMRWIYCSDEDMKNNRIKWFKLFDYKDYLDWDFSLEHFNANDIYDAYLEPARTNKTNATSASEAGNNTDSSNSSTDSNNNSSSDIEYNTSEATSFIWPLNGYYTISSDYSDRISPISGKSEMHNGIDIPAPIGTPIYAVADGTVDWAWTSSSAGNWMGIAHGNGLYSVYMHMSAFAVSSGTYVKQGQIIGYVGSTGWSTGAHLHLSFRLNGSYVNPHIYVG